MLSDPQISPWPQRLVLISGYFCIVLGLLVMIGWHLQSDLLIQTLPFSALMYYNVAVGFLLYGIGFLGVAYDKPPLIKLSAVLVVCLGLSTLSQYLFGIDLGIDQLLKSDNTQTTFYPGRMSPITAILFVLSGGALFLHEQRFLLRLNGALRLQSSRSGLASQHFLSQTTVVLELIVVIVTTWGVVTALLYLVGTMESRILGNIPNMAFHSAAGFSVIGIGLFALAWRENTLTVFGDSLAAFITGIFTVALLLQLALSSLSYRNITEMRTNIEQKNRSESIVYLLEQLLSELKDAETGQRGYLLTGENNYLEPYTGAVSLIRMTLRDLEILGRNSRALSKEDLEVLQGLTEQKLAELKETVTLRQEQNLAEALKIVQSDVGESTMNRIRVLTRGIIDRERAALAQEAKKISASMQETRTSLMYGSGFSLFFVPVAAMFISWQLWRRRVTESELRVLNTNLDRQVEARTAELAEANVELQRENIERVRAQESLAYYVSELARSNSELEHFAHVASHDLQEPLRKILAFGDRLKVKSGAGLNEQGRDYLERMQSAAARMQALIDDLLTFSRVTTQPRPFAPVDLSTVAHTIVSDMEISIQRVNGQVHLDPLPTIDADAVQMGQVLQNLIGNALKFHRKDVSPVVTVSAELVNNNEEMKKDSTQPQLCRITVRDNGIGFDEKYAEQIFQPFQRLFARGEYEGTGMGLAICKRIIERHRGSISAHSMPGEGTTFVITLPVHQEKEITQ